MWPSSLAYDDVVSRAGTAGTGTAMGSSSDEPKAGAAGHPSVALVAGGDGASRPLCESVHAAVVDAGLLEEGVSSDDAASNSLCESEHEIKAGPTNGGPPSSSQAAIAASDSANGNDVCEATKRPASRSNAHGTRRKLAAILAIAAISTRMPLVSASKFAQAKGLCVGSADPHMLSDATEHWAPRSGAATSLAQHEPADPSELIARPFPAMNVPPPTDRVYPPQLPSEQPPEVWREDQVVPAKVLQRVGNWRRRLRRCLSFAALGNLSMARRMRPPDVWIPVEAGMTDATRQWNWDFTPLARGEPARPLPVSSGGGLRPDTSLQIDELIRERERGIFADQGILDEMIDGMQDDVVDARGTLLCAPHTSALAHWAVAVERVQRNVTRGWAHESGLPCWPLRACPYGIVDESGRAGEPKWRLTNDLSWPPPNSLPAGGGEFVTSHNAASDRDRWPPARMINMRQVAVSAAIMQQAGAPVAVWSIDCEAFYRKMGRQQCQVWRNVMAVANGFQVDRRCCFGSAADAAKCSRVSNFLAAQAGEAIARVDALFPTRDARILAWQEARRAAREDESDAETCDALGRVGMYIDDAPACSFDDPLYDREGRAVLRDGKHVTRAWAHFDAVREMLARFGHESKESKEQPPSQWMEVLGVSLCLASRRIRLSDGKRESYATRAEAAMQLRQMPRQEYLRLLGRLQFAATCYPRGRQWLQAAWRVARAQFRLSNDHVQITARVRADLRRWRDELLDDSHPGVPLACRPDVDPVGCAGSGAIYADASGEWGWGAWTVQGTVLYWCGGQWSPHVRDGLHINEKELYASTAGLMALAPVTSMRSVHSFTDNTTAMGVMRSLRARNVRMQELTARRVTWMLERGISEATHRVTSAANLWSDMISRGASAAVVEQAAALGLSAQQIAPPPAMGCADFLLPLGDDTA